MSLAHLIKQNLINIPGWRTNRKIIVFESDDWGSIRMRSNKDYNDFLEMGFNVNQCAYNKYDSLENNDDLSELFNILGRFSDKNKNLPIFTLNNIVANPNFEKIKKSDFKEYHYEPFTETLSRYPKHDNVMALYHKGIRDGLIMTQFHGREHLNINRWMNALQKREENLIAAFDREMFTVYKKGSVSGRKNYLDTLGNGNSSSILEYKKILKSGLTLFEEIWGFKSKSFIAPTYVWPIELEESLHDMGVNYLQGTHVQRIPKLDHEKGISKRYHYLGQKNKLGQIYLVRNAFFEPSSDDSKDWIDSCLRDIERAFKWGKPAIIGTHRVNYIGGIHENNRVNNLHLLSVLLEKIILRYPDIEFISSDELGDMINSRK